MIQSISVYTREVRIAVAIHPWKSWWCVDETSFSVATNKSIEWIPAKLAWHVREVKGWWSTISLTQIHERWKIDPHHFSCSNVSLKLKWKFSATVSYCWWFTNPTAKWLRGNCFPVLSHNFNACEFYEHFFRFLQVADSKNPRIKVIYRREESENTRAHGEWGQK